MKRFSLLIPTHTSDSDQECPGRESKVTMYVSSGVGLFTSPCWEVLSLHKKCGLSVGPYKDP